MNDERQETVDAILAEMRYAPIPKHDRDIELLRMFANRLEAAWKRERAEIEAQALSIGGIVESSRHTQKPQGNAAEMLNALRRIIDYPSLADTAKKDKWQLRRWIEGCRKNAIDALSAPPRNCDAMPWRKAWDEWRAKHHPQNPQTFNESYEAMVAFMEWFTAPASEKGATA